MLIIIDTNWIIIIFKKIGLFIGILKNSKVVIGTKLINKIFSLYVLDNTTFFLSILFVRIVKLGIIIIGNKINIIKLIDGA